MTIMDFFCRDSIQFCLIFLRQMPSCVRFGFLLRIISSNMTIQSVIFVYVCYILNVSVIIQSYFQQSENIFLIMGQTILFQMTIQSQLSSQIILVQKSIILKKKTSSNGHLSQQGYYRIFSKIIPKNLSYYYITCITKSLMMFQSQAILIKSVLIILQQFQFLLAIFMEKSKKDKKKYTGFPGDCSEQQLAALNKFRQIAKTINNGEFDQRWDNAYLLRFLRARKFNLKDTEKMWVDFINWRKQMQVDKLRTYYFPQLAALRKIYPHGYHKVDKKYRPIYIERPGLTLPADIFKLTNEESLLKYYAMSYETLLTTIFDACTQQKLRETGDGTKVNQTCTILDLKDIKLSKVNDAYKFAKPASQMTQNNYPQILGNMFIINAPFLFTGVWAIVKMWIDDKTKEKIQILGKDYKKELLKYIDPENLPDFLDGGKCKCPGGDCLSLNIGPWNPEGQQFFPHCLQKGKQYQYFNKLAKKQIQSSKEAEYEKKDLVQKMSSIQVNSGKKQEETTLKTQTKSIQP